MIYSVAHLHYRITSEILIECHKNSKKNFKQTEWKEKGDSRWEEKYENEINAVI